MTSKGADKMARKFNINGTCLPEKHYMVNLDTRLKKIRSMVEDGEYFVINRARQYGKTTTLWAINRELKNDYLVILLDFQCLSNSAYESENAFSTAFAALFVEAATNSGVNTDALDGFRSITADGMNLPKLFTALNQLISNEDKEIVLIIDEVDSASNNVVFLDFLAQLRAAYLSRNIRKTFQSVILAGVYDIRNLKLKLRPDEQHQYNSPWNIAAPFDVDMSFSAADIAGMITDYEADHSTGMDIAAISQEIYNYTSGYPFLVSRICKLIDEQPLSWDIDGVERAVKLILNEKNTLFDDLFKKLHEYSSLLDILRRMLFSGISYSYNLYDPAIDLGTMFGILANNNGSLCVTNRIFETMLYNYFLFEEQNSKTYSAGALNKNQFVENGELNMDLVMQKFVEHFTEVYRDNDSTFVEENGRKLFLLYLKPIINGTGNYYIEAATRDMKRTDIVIDYLGKQFIIEMKIWHGDEYNKRGEKQLAEYLDSYKQDKGWLLSFNFNKNKKVGITTIECDGKTIVEAVV